MSGRTRKTVLRPVLSLPPDAAGFRPGQLRRRPGTRHRGHRARPGPRGVRTAPVLAHRHPVIADLSQGGSESACEHAPAIEPSGSTMTNYVPHLLSLAMDLVEATSARAPTGSGRTGRVHAMQEAGTLAALSSAARAILGQKEPHPPSLFNNEQLARALRARALNFTSVDQSHFDVARMRLAYRELLHQAPHRRRRPGSGSFPPRSPPSRTQSGPLGQLYHAKLECRLPGSPGRHQSVPGMAALTPPGADRPPRGFGHDQQTNHRTGSSCHPGP